MAGVGKALAALERRWEKARAGLSAVGEPRPGALVRLCSPCGKPTSAGTLLERFDFSCLTCREPSHTF